MQTDDEGFAYPFIDEKQCIDCGRCEKICPIIQERSKNDSEDQPTTVPTAIGGWIKDDAVRYDSSSGGAFSLFAEWVLEQNGIVYGAALCQDMVVRHIGINSIEELKKLRKSKYVQSEIGNTYSEIQEQLKAGRIVLFTGTPCQAAGLRSFLSYKTYENLYILDFICHGVSSPLVFSQYLQDQSVRINDSIVDFHFRVKDKGWNSNKLGTGTCIYTENGKTIRYYPAFRDHFINGFSDDLYLRLSCYDCAFKSIPKTYSDITIADFWGVKKIHPELDDKRGTSLILLNTDRGKALFEKTKNSFFYKEVNFSEAVRENPSLIKSALLNQNRDKFFKDFREKPFKDVSAKYMNAFVWGWHKAGKVFWQIIEKVIRTVLTPLLSLVHINWTETQWENFFQFVRFAMVGVSNVIVSYTVNVCTLLLVRSINNNLTYDYMIANVTAFLLSVFWSWFWNSRKVFKTEGSNFNEKIKSLLKTYASYAFTGLFLNNLLSTFWIRIVGVSKFISPLLNIPISMPINFLILKKWAYKKPGRKI